MQATDAAVVVIVARNHWNVSDAKFGETFEAATQSFLADDRVFGTRNDSEAAVPGGVQPRNHGACAVKLVATDGIDRRVAQKAVEENHRHAPTFKGVKL